VSFAVRKSSLKRICCAKSVKKRLIEIGKGGFWLSVLKKDVDVFSVLMLGSFVVLMAAGVMFFVLALHNYPIYTESGRYLVGGSPELFNLDVLLGVVFIAFAVVPGYFYGRI